MNGPETVCVEGEGVGQACNGSSTQKSIRVGALWGVSVRRTWGRPSPAKYLLEANTQCLKLLGDDGLRELDGRKALEKTFWF